jgi:hypothetical protein
MRCILYITWCFCGNNIVEKHCKNLEHNSTRLLKLKKEVRRKGDSL